MNMSTLTIYMCDWQNKGYENINHKGHGSTLLVFSIHELMLKLVI